jgi:hypothetical protein
MAGFWLWYNSHKHAPDRDSNSNHVQPRGPLQVMGPWPGRIFVISSLDPEYVVKPSNFDFQSGYRPIGIHWSDTSVKIKLHALGSSDRLHATFNLQHSGIFIRWCTGLMMCSIHIDEFAIHVSIIAQSSCLWVPFSKKLDSLHNRLHNRCTMYNFQCDTWGSKWRPLL